MLPTLPEPPWLRPSQNGCARFPHCPRLLTQCLDVPVACHCQGIIDHVTCRSRRGGGCPRTIGGSTPPFLSSRSREWPVPEHALTSRYSAQRPRRRRGDVPTISPHVSSSARPAALARRQCTYAAGDSSFGRRDVVAARPTVGRSSGPGERPSFYPDGKSVPGYWPSKRRLSARLPTGGVRKAEGRMRARFRLGIRCESENSPGIGTLGAGAGAGRGLT
ncbi:hypothetical protein BC628DRAFT_247383 [Trametes gibbosa]|nr:hypothetical protein BC628DRAFT_247383 [Trametes gibbosa]